MTLQELESQVENGRPQRAGQLERAREVLREHPDAVLIECADEYTGRRRLLAGGKDTDMKLHNVGETEPRPGDPGDVYEVWRDGDGTYAVRSRPRYNLGLLFTERQGLNEAEALRYAQGLCDVLYR